jgi:predicted DNA-binding transcriptional regulator YafY
MFMSHRDNLTERTVLIPLLLVERAYSQKELATLFNVDTKTIRRNINVLSSHYPITEERCGRELYYHSYGSQTYKSPQFTPIELATLLLAQESIAATGLTTIGSPFSTYAQSLLLKVRASLPEFIRNKLDAMSKILGSASVPAKDFAPQATIIDQLVHAALECRRVRLKYHTLGTNLITERIVEPYAVYFDPDGATLKLVGFDHHRKGIRPFSIDHIRSLHETTEGFTKPADFDLHEFLSENCFNGIHGEPVTVRLRAYDITARIFAERMFHRSQRIIEKTIDPETITIEMRVAGGRGLLRFILSWGPGVEVLNPTSVRNEVIDSYNQTIERYKNE